MTQIQFYYPEKMGRIVLQAVEEVIGLNGIHSALQLASLKALIDNYPPPSTERKFAFETLSKLLSTLEQAYGPRGGRGVALRVGRVCFKYGLKEYGTQLGLTELAFRLLPLSTKLRVGARSFSELFNRHTDQVVRVEETDAKILWHIERCPLCWERHEAEPVCHLAVGLLQESLYWLSGGKLFNVEETSCIARGDACCTIEIEKTPIS
jgi:predicted hydrocarbon binding protein